MTAFPVGPPTERSLRTTPEGLLREAGERWVCGRKGDITERPESVFSALSSSARRRGDRGTGPDTTFRTGSRRARGPA
ncbi:hypothetical protein BX257_1681 [Streptomyces sp. 3212.3]|nr:hypothetical protein BX257_1681 [Streptomyces sp. 3212.3]